MKRFLILCATLAACADMLGQFNIQLHYDLGRNLNPDAEADRQLFTVTTEFFKPDRLGSTFLFIDMDYRGKGTGNNGPLAAYWEMSRDFTMLKVRDTAHSLTAHIEYNGGLNTYASYQQALLAGPAWQWHSQDFSKTFTLQALYRQVLRSGASEAHPSFQLTTVWGVEFAKGWCTFSGYADLWYGYTPRAEKGLVFMSEPQLWVNVLGRGRQDDRLSLGTEWEVSYDFVWPAQGSRRIFLNPTVAVKYTF
ncbi:MAG: DUF5020 family protein [Prevotella sp.]|nr:DUF5020 family protein [Prevotella sp.]